MHKIDNVLKIELELKKLFKLMNELLQHDLGASLLSIAIVLGWLGIGFVCLRILAILLKKILEVLFKKP